MVTDWLTVKVALDRCHEMRYNHSCNDTRRFPPEIIRKGNFVSIRDYYITLEQLAATFGRPVRTVNDWILGGVIPQEMIARAGPGKTSAYLIHISAVNLLESKFNLIADLSKLDNNRSKD